jgi:hypothetical protein
MQCLLECSNLQKGLNQAKRTFFAAAVTVSVKQQLLTLMARGFGVS